MGEVDRMGSYRAFVHPDGEYLSIGFEDTNDTLLKMPDGARDRARVGAWVDAVNRSRGAVEERDRLRALLKQAHDRDKWLGELPPIKWYDDVARYFRGQ